MSKKAIKAEELEAVMLNVDSAASGAVDLVELLNKGGPQLLATGAVDGQVDIEKLVELQRKLFLACRDLSSAGASLYTLIRVAVSEAQLGKL
jgi:hypothetical protein